MNHIHVASGPHLERRPTGSRHRAVVNGADRSRRGCAIKPIDPSDAGLPAPTVGVAPRANAVLIWRAKALIQTNDHDEIRNALRKFEADQWTGPDYEAFRTALFGAAHAVVLKLGPTGLIPLARRFGRPPQWTYAITSLYPDFEDFVVDACIEQLKKFEHRIRTKHAKAWRAGGGASALTYFVNGIARDLPNLVRARMRRRAREQKDAPVDGLGEDIAPGGGAAVLDQVMLSAECAEVLREAPPHVAAGLWLRALGWQTDGDIAAELDIPVEKLRRDRAAFLRKIRKERGTE